MNTGRFSASSFAGTRTLTSSVSAAGRVIPACACAPRGRRAGRGTWRRCGARSGRPLLEDVHDRLVGERLRVVLLADQLLDLGLDPRAPRPRPGRGERAREEELQRQHAARGLDELLVRHPAHGGLVHVDDFGHLAQRERLEELHALLEEVALPVDDVVHDLEHRLPALLDRLDHPVGAVELGGDELLVLPVELLLVARDLLVRLAEVEPRHAASLRKTW